MSAHPSLTVIDNRVSRLINTDFSIDVLDDTCAFSEGPVWNRKGHYLFSDIPRNAILRIAPGEPKTLFLSPSGCTLEDQSALGEQVGSNGLAYAIDGRLLICQHGNGAIGMWDGERLEPFLPGFGDRRFNSPNDIVVHGDGTVFFSDPPYGLKEGKPNAGFAQPVAGLYRHRAGKTVLLTEAFNYPNGVCLSPDGNTLYCCSSKPAEKTLLTFDVQTGASKGILCAENGDGIKCDLFGNLWLCTKEGILVLDNTGSRLALIALPAIPANCCWGGAAGQDLLVTARNYILHIPGLLKGPERA